jgi:hypothetical protein
MKSPDHNNKSGRHHTDCNVKDHLDLLQVPIKILKLFTCSLIKEVIPIIPMVAKKPTKPIITADPAPRRSRNAFTSSAVGGIGVWQPEG